MEQNVNVTWFITSPSGFRVSSMPPMETRETAATDLPRITVQTDRRFQRIDGFGGTFNESGWHLLQKLDELQRQSVLRAFFDSQVGAGYSVCVAPIGHNDYSLEYYSYDETPDDLELDDFSIARDFQFLIPYIRAAASHGDFALATRPDYPPAWMLTDDRNLKREYYPVFARYLVRYLEAYREAGIKIDWVSLFNEPRIYVNITGEEMNDLLRDHVGPLIRERCPEVRLQLCDSYNRDEALHDWLPALRDPETRRYLDGLAYHSYHWERTSLAGIRGISVEYPELPIWQTEVMNLYTKPLYNYSDGEVWGKIIIDDLNAGASAWIFWNMIVDENGGPWNLDPFNRGYPQDGVAVLNTKTLETTFTAKYYYQTHFSRFIRPGAVRLGYTVTQRDHPFPDNALFWFRILPFENPDGTVGLICMNTNEYEETAMVGLAGRDVRITLPGHSIATYLWE